MKLLQRIKRIKDVFTVANADQEFIDNAVHAIEENKRLMNNGTVFFGEGTEAEFKEWEQEQKGMKGWLNRLKNL